MTPLGDITGTYGDFPPRERKNIYIFFIETGFMFPGIAGLCTIFL